MPRYALDFYSGYLEEVLGTIGSRDITLVERFLRLRDHTQRTMGLPEFMMEGWTDSVESLLMEPPETLRSMSDGVAFASLLADAGQRRFRVFLDGRDLSRLHTVFAHLGHEDWANLFVDSTVRGYQSTHRSMSWGFLDVSQIEQVLTELFGNDSFKTPRTAAIAGRLSDYSRQEAERALLEVGIETQNSVSHNIDYLIIGSKGTGGTKHDKVQALQDSGHRIVVLDEDGFDRLLRAPVDPAEGWLEETVFLYESLIRALRHVWAFELDLYALLYEHDTSVPLM